MDDEAKQLLREIRVASLRTESAKTDESTRGVFVSHDEVERTRRRIERRQYLFALGILAAFGLGMMAGYYLALGGGPGNVR